MQKRDREFRKRAKKNGMLNSNFDNAKTERLVELWLKPAIIFFMWRINRKLRREFKDTPLPDRLRIFKESCYDAMKENGDDKDIFLNWFERLSIDTYVMFLAKDNAYLTRHDNILKKYYENMYKEKMVI